MKSKAEIVVETLLHYNIKNLGYNREEDYCTYLDKSTGNKCAVGRCILDTELKKVSKYERLCINQNYGSPSVTTLAINFNDLDALLIPEYRGHDIQFWTDLQSSHDSSYMWNENGFDVSDRSLARITRLFGSEVGEAVRATFANISE